MKDEDRLAGGFARFVVAKIRDHRDQVVRCVKMLNQEQLWFRPNAHSNSVANLVLHLCGNSRQWILGGLGGEHVERDRPAEFARREGLGAAELATLFGKTIDRACAVIAGLDRAALEGEHAIQGYRVVGVEAVAHVLEHLAFHTGQIVTTTKWLLDVDLSLYDGQGRRIDGGGKP